VVKKLPGKSFLFSVTYNIVPNYPLAAMRDRALANTVALRTMKVIYPDLVDANVGCYSHTFDRVGEQFNAPTLSEFVTAWISLFSRNNFSCNLEMFNIIFLQNEDLGSPITRGKPLKVIADPQKISVLEIELAAVVDGVAPFVKATYTLEGDGALAVECYEIVDTIRAAIHAAHTPNVQAIARKVEMSLQYNNSSLTMHVHVWSLAYIRS